MEVDSAGNQTEFGQPPEAVRWLVLHAVFHGDPHEWVDYLLHRGSQRQRLEDLPFAINLAMRQRNEDA